MKPYIIQIVLILSAIIMALADDPDVITMPEEVLKYIIGCKQPTSGHQFSVPVHRTEINDVSGTTSQQVSLLSLEELRHSLRQTVNSDDVIGQIIDQVEDATKANKLATGRSDCTVENNISISVPAQEIDDFNDRVQMLMQQNSLLLLEQINTLFAFKLRAQKTATEKLIKRKTNLIMNRLDKIMAHLGIPIEDVDEDKDDVLYPSTVAPSDELDPTMFPIIPPFPGTGAQPEAQPEPETQTELEPEPTTTSSYTEFQTKFPDVGNSSEEEDEYDDILEEPESTVIPVPSPNDTAQTQSEQQIRVPQIPQVFTSGVAVVPALLSTRGRESQRPKLRPIYQRPSPQERISLLERRRINRRPLTG